MKYFKKFIAPLHRVYWILNQTNSKLIETAITKSQHPLTLHCTKFVHSCVFESARLAYRLSVSSLLYKVRGFIITQKII